VLGGAYHGVLLKSVDKCIKGCRDCLFYGMVRVRLYKVMVMTPAGHEAYKAVKTSFFRPGY